VAANTMRHFQLSAVFEERSDARRPDSFA